jgi:hypothetical protein
LTISAISWVRAAAVRPHSKVRKRKMRDMEWLG